jgi:sugar phosphate isomerase/epimerase
VTEAARRLGGVVEAVAIKDAHGTPDDFTFPPLGQGDIDFRGMLDQLRLHGFDGVCSVEHEAHYHGIDTRDWNIVLRESREFVEKLIGDSK